MEDARELIRKLILDILARKRSAAKPEDVKEGVSLTRDLGIDSLDILQLCVTVEKKLGLKFPESEIKNMDDLGGILAVVARLRR